MIKLQLTNDLQQEMNFRELLTKYDSIVIPMIQRDYAQGRNDLRAKEIRKNLLDDIFIKKQVKFDFIFGTEKKVAYTSGSKKIFIPLDGQQRLTTLFLLYVYAQKRSECSSFVKNNQLNLQYETRRAAQDFCAALVSQQNEWHVTKGLKLSECLRNQKWFLDYWLQDPTVDSMLNMLDDISEYCNMDKGKFDFSYLDQIKFRFFDLKQHNLDEKLYLKMNSRGKPLTSYENFKAEIDKILPTCTDKNIFSNIEKIDPVLAKLGTFKQKWQYCIDRQWLNLFWKVHSNFLVDTPMLSFISVVSAGILASRESASNNQDEKMDVQLHNEEISNLIDLSINEDDFVPFRLFKPVFKTEDDFRFLARFMSNLSCDLEKIEKKSTSLWGRKISFLSTLKPGSNFTERSVVFGAACFASNNYDSEEFTEWMNFIWNLAENYVEGKEQYINFCKLIKKEFSKYSENITHRLKTISTHEFTKITIAHDQLQEERFKSKLKANGDWKDAIKRAEGHPLLRGAIRFTFKNYHSETEPDLVDFCNRITFCEEIFDEKGVKEIKRPYFLRAFVSQFTHWDQLWNINYDNSPETWRHLLKSELHKEPLSKLVYIENFEQLISKTSSAFNNVQLKVHEDLYKSDLTSNIEVGSKLNHYEGKYLLYPYNAKADWKKYIIGNKRNELLSNLNIITKQKNNNCDYYWGWNIDFEWSNRKFKWSWNDEIVCENSSIISPEFVRNINTVNELEEHLVKLLTK